MKYDGKYAFQLLDDLVEHDEVFLVIKHDAPDLQTKLFHYCLLEDEGLAEVSAFYVPEENAAEDAPLVTQYHVRLTAKGWNYHSDESGDGDE